MYDPELISRLTHLLAALNREKLRELPVEQVLRVAAIEVEVILKRARMLDCAEGA